MGLLAHGTPCAALPLCAPPSFPHFWHVHKRVGGGGGAPKWMGGDVQPRWRGLPMNGRGGTIPCASPACMQRGRACTRRVAHKPGGGGAAWVEVPAHKQQGRGDALSALTPACVQRRWRVCSWSGVQPGQRGLLPMNGKEGGWSTVPPVPLACTQ